jgi:hypothetical protein
MRFFACAVLVAALVTSCHASAPRDASDNPHPIARTGLALALDGDEVVLAIWVTRTGPAPIDETWIERVPKTNGVARRVAVLRGKVRSKIVTSTGDVVASTLNQPSLFVVPKTGGEARVLSSRSELPTKHGLGYTGVAIVGGGDILFGVDNGNTIDEDEDADGGVVWNPSLYRVPFTGGKARDLTDVLGIDRLFVRGDDAFATFCVLGADYPKDGGIVRDLLGGGPAKQLAANQIESGKCPSGLAVDDTDVYFTLGDHVRRVSKDGGMATTISNGGDARAVVLDDRYVYVAFADTIEAIDKSTEKTVVLAETRNPVALVTDATHVYWQLEHEGYFRRAPKPK